MTKISEFRKMIKCFDFTLEVIGNKYLYCVEELIPIARKNVERHSDAYLLRCLGKHWVEREEGYYE